MLHKLTEIVTNFPKTTIGLNENGKLVKDIRKWRPND